MSLPLTQRYKGLMGLSKPLIETANKLGSTLPPKRRQVPISQPAPTSQYASPKAIDMSQYSNLSKQMRGNAPSVGQMGAISTQYGGSTNYEKFHPGVDIANKMGTPVYSTVQGKVTDVVSGRKQGEKGFGNYVMVTDDKGNKHRYSHLSNSFVKVGDVIPRGYVYGTMGDTGSTYSTNGGDASHLDYRIQDAYNKYVNPMTFFKQ